MWTHMFFRNITLFRIGRQLYCACEISPLNHYRPVSLIWGSISSFKTHKDINDSSSNSWELGLSRIETHYSWGLNVHTLPMCQRWQRGGERCNLDKERMWKHSSCFLLQRVNVLDVILESWCWSWVVINILYNHFEIIA